MATHRGKRWSLKKIVEMWRRCTGESHLPLAQAVSSNRPQLNGRKTKHTSFSGVCTQPQHSMNIILCSNQASLVRSDMACTCGCGLPQDEWVLNHLKMPHCLLLHQLVLYRTKIQRQRLIIELPLKKIHLIRQLTKITQHNTLLWFHPSSQIYEHQSHREPISDHGYCRPIAINLNE